MITFVIENNDFKKEIAIEPEEKVLSLKKKNNRFIRFTS